MRKRDHLERHICAVCRRTSRLLKRLYRVDLTISIWRTRRHTRMQSVFRFDDLFEDIQIYIVAHFLTIPDLLSLALVSRHCNFISTPTLSLEIHRIWGIAPLSWPIGPGTQHRDVLREARRRICTALSDKLPLESYAHTIAWYLNSTADSKCSWTEDLATRRNIKRIHRTNRCRSRIVLGESLLSLLSISVKLEGLPSTDLARAVIHSNRLQELSFDINSIHGNRLSPFSWISDIRFPLLKKLSLRYLGELPVGVGHGWLPVAQEISLLDFWRKLLVSVHETLETVTLGFKPIALGSAKDHQSSVKRLAQCVLPVFFEDKFPFLGMLELQGVWIGDGGISPDCIVALQGVVDLVVTN